MLSIQIHIAVAKQAGIEVEPAEFEIPLETLAEEVVKFCDRNIADRSNWTQVDEFFKLPDSFWFDTFFEALPDKKIVKEQSADPWLLIRRAPNGWLIIRWVHLDDALAKKDGRTGCLINYTEDGAGKFFEVPGQWFREFTSDHPGSKEIAGLLANSETNPLSILLRSPQPYKGLAQQVVAKLNAVEEETTK
ncbi:MAG: hypothetical protein HY398_01290 [Candidatus Doudnabacteria bacterium]|nr:hypothetical protein [Candidatus Doudnabacteria bacterium]